MAGTDLATSGIGIGRVGAIGNWVVGGVAMSVMKCAMCNRKVGESFKSKWNHVAQYHPAYLLRGLLTIAQNPKGFGEMVGRYAKNAIN